MALYTLKTREEAESPLRNYTGDNGWVLNQIASLNGTPSPATTQVYSALGRTTGAEGNGGSNFFEKRGRSIENALGTTGSAIVSAVNDRIENNNTERDRKNAHRSMNDIAKKYGFNSWSDWQDANAAARESGDTEAIKRFDTQLKEFQAQANANAAKANKKAANYEDYRKNDYISNKINQDRGKFAGSAINTLSTAVDVSGLGATPISNAIQGGIEGVADELEQNGFENFDWGRAGQNAAIGATTGAVTGALNAGISNSLAKRAAAKGLTNTATKAGLGSALKNGARAIATGAARGALSGAVGGATGAGLQSALNGVEFGQGVQNALQGAVQGAQQGAVTGGIMAGANAAFGKTNFGKQLQNAKTNWDRSGSNFDERLTNTLTSGDSAVGDWLMNRRQSRVLGAAGNLGNRVQDVSDITDNTQRKALANEAEKLIQTSWDANHREDEIRSITGALQNLDANLESGQNAINRLSTADKQTRWMDRARTLSRIDESTKAITECDRLLNDSALGQQTKSLISSMRDELVRGNNGMKQVWDQLDSYETSSETPTTTKGTNKYVGVDTLGNRTEYTPAQLTKLISDYDNYKQSTTLSGNSFDEVSDVVGPAGSELMNIYKTMNGGVPVDPYSRESWGEFESWLNTQRSNTPTTAKGTVRLYRGLEQEYDPNYPSSKLDTNGYESWTDNPELAKQYGKNVYYIDVPESDIQGSYLDENPNSPTYGDRYPLYKTTKAAGLNGISGNEYQLEVGSDYQKGLTYTPLEGTDTPTTAKGWAKKAGQRIVEDMNNSNLGNRVKDVSSDMPEDIRNMQIRDYNANADGEIDTTYGIASDPRVRQQLLANVNAQLAENPNARIGDTNFDADAIISEYSDRLTPEQYRNFNPTDAENALVQELQGLEASQGFTRPNSRQITQTTQVDPWDRVAQEAGYSNYDEVLQRYAEANPNAKINPRGMAGQVLTWMDQNPNTPTTAAGWAKRAGQRAVEDINNSNLGLKVQDVSQDDPSRRLYNALAGNRQPVAETEVEAEADMGTIPSKTSKESKLRYARGKELVAQYGTVDAPMARATNAVKTFQRISDMGFEDPTDVEFMANAITGSNGYVSTLNRNIIKSAKPVDTFTGDSGQTLDEFIDNSIAVNKLSGLNEGVAVKRSIDAYLKSLPSRAEGSVDYKDSAADTFKVVQGLEASAAELEGRGGSTYHRADTVDLHQAAVLKDVANLLKNRIYDGSNARIAITPQVVKEMKALAPGNEKWSTTVDDFAKNVKTPQDLRRFQEPFVKAGRYIDNQYVQAATVGGRMAANAGELPSTLRTTKAGIINDLVNRAWNSNMAHRGRAALYGKLADRAAEKATNNPTTAKGWTKQAGQRAAEDLGNTNLGNRIQDVSGQPVNPQVATPAELANTVADYDPSTQLYNAIGRTEGLSNAEQANTANYLVDAVQEAEIIPTATAPTSSETALTPIATANGSAALYDALGGTSAATSAQTTTQPTQSTNKKGYFDATGDYWTDILASAMSSAIDANDVNAFASLYGMYQNALAGLSSNNNTKDYSNPTNWTSSDRSKLISAQNGLDQIDQLENAYINATGGSGSNAVQGWLRSRAADISGGNWDPTASNYNNLAESVGMGIIKNLINLGVTEADAERYKKYLPALTDTKEQAIEKLATLRNIYQSQINNLYSAYGL